MSLQVGIVGLPNVGKSTLFNALTSAKAEAANYPFCTIDPNVGVVTVPDPRLDQIAAIFKPEKTLPTTMEFVDIAGLVAGASKGEGLGNQFLGHIRQVDAIAHVVRCFDDPNVIHVAGSVDPQRDIDVIDTELMLADFDTVDKRLQRIEKSAKVSGDAELKKEYEVLKALHEALSAGRPARAVTLTEAQEPTRKGLHLLTAKPVLFVCNVSEEDLSQGGNPWVEKVKAIAQSQGQKAIVICSQMEAEIAQLDLAERAEFLSSMGVSEPGLHRLIREAYSLLGFQTYFTAGPKEVRAWTVPVGCRAPQAAGVIHSDFEKGFIRAEAYNCQDLLSLGSEGAVKDAGKYRSEGKEYVVKDGDVLFFKFNV